MTDRTQPLYRQSDSGCERGTCWAGPLSEACDHWKAEVERLRLRVLALENAGNELAAQLGEAEEEIVRLREGLRTVTNVGDRAAVLTAEEVLRG